MGRGREGIVGKVLGDLQNPRSATLHHAPGQSRTRGGHLVLSGAEIPNSSEPILLLWHVQKVGSELIVG